MEKYDAGETLNLTRLKGQASKKFSLQGLPKMCDILQGLPMSHRKQLWPFLKTKPVRTASGVAVVAVMAKRTSTLKRHQLL
jgi:elongator complex protein 3